jgi:ABC-2 type transport system ATP-binding protein
MPNPSPRSPRSRPYRPRAYGYPYGFGPVNAPSSGAVSQSLYDTHTQDPAISVVGLVKHYGDVRAVDGVDFEVAPGTVFGLLGPNGAGKTTAVRVLTTLQAPDAGQIRVAGIDAVAQPALLREQIGLAGQNAALDEVLSGQQNLVMVGRLYGMKRREAKARAAELLESFDLSDAADRTVKKYSGGMRRRLDLAAALVAHPPVLFLDEPTTGLDPRSRLDLWAMIENLVADGTTVLLTTQYLDEADRLADDIAVIDHGKVIAQGTPAELKRRVGGERMEVELEDPGDGAAAVEALRALCEEEPVAEERRVTLAVSTREGTIVAAVQLLGAAGVGVADINVRTPTMDDVFLSLTGRVAEHETRTEGDQPEAEAEEAAA